VALHKWVRLRENPQIPCKFEGYSLSMEAKVSKMGLAKCRSSAPNVYLLRTFGDTATPAACSTSKKFICCQFHIQTVYAHGLSTSAPCYLIPFCKLP
jgi:hypothetical protein